MSFHVNLDNKAELRSSLGIYFFLTPPFLVLMCFPISTPVRILGFFWVKQKQYVPSSILILTIILVPWTVGCTHV